MFILLLDLALVIGSGIVVQRTSVFEKHFCLLMCLFISSVWLGLADLAGNLAWSYRDIIFVEPLNPTITRGLIAFGTWYTVFNNRGANRSVFRSIEGKEP
jgi:hypothetical protein